MKLYISNNNNNRGHRAQELCESRRGRPGLPVPNKPYGTEPEDGSHHTDSLWTRSHGIGRTACLPKWVTAMAIVININRADAHGCNSTLALLWLVYLRQNEPVIKKGGSKNNKNLFLFKWLKKCPVNTIVRTCKWSAQSPWSQNSWFTKKNSIKSKLHVTWQPGKMPDNASTTEEDRADRMSWLQCSNT